MTKPTIKINKIKRNREVRGLTRKSPNGCVSAMFAGTVANECVHEWVGFVVISVDDFKTVTNGLGMWLSVTVVFLQIGDGWLLTELNRRRMEIIDDGWLLKELNRRQFDLKNLGFFGAYRRAWFFSFLTKMRSISWVLK